MITCVIVFQVEKTRLVSESAVFTGSFERSFNVVRDRDSEGVGRHTRMNERSKESS